MTQHDQWYKCRHRPVGFHSSFESAYQENEEKSKQRKFQCPFIERSRLVFPGSPHQQPAGYWTCNGNLPENKFNGIVDAVMRGISFEEVKVNRRKIILVLPPKMRQV